MRITTQTQYDQEKAKEFKVLLMSPSRASWLWQRAAGRSLQSWEPPVLSGQETQRSTQRILRSDSVSDSGNFTRVIYVPFIKNTEKIRKGEELFMMIRSRGEKASFKPQSRSEDVKLIQPITVAEPCAVITAML